MAQQAGIIQGRILSLFVGGVVVDDQLDSSFTLTRDISEVTTKASAGQAKEYQADYYTGTANLSGYLSFDATEGVTQAIADIKAGAAIALIFDTETAGNATYASSGILTNVNVSFPKDGPATYSFDYQFTGEFTESTTA